MTVLLTVMVAASAGALMESAPRLASTLMRRRAVQSAPWPTVAPARRGEALLRPASRSTRLREAEQLSVIASSVMALGVLPGEELKAMLIGVCEAMPSDALKALLLAAGASIEPRQHKAIVMFAAPAWVAAAIAGNHSDEKPLWAKLDKVGREATRSTVRRLVPRRAAKAALNKWVRDTDADELKRVSLNAARRVDPERLATIAPRVLAAIVGAPPPAAAAAEPWWTRLWKTDDVVQDDDEDASNATSRLAAREAILDSKLDARTAAWLVPRTLLALPARQRRTAIADGVRSLSESRASALLASPVVAAAVADDEQDRAARVTADDEDEGLGEPAPLSTTPAWLVASRGDVMVAQSAVTDAVERLPPALVAAQLRSLVESLPARFVRDEAVALVEALPPKELVEAATSLIDAAPERALRSLAAKLLDAVADGSQQRKPNSAAALHSLARAAEACDVEILRSTAREMLSGVRPRRVAEEAVRLLSTDEAPYRVKRAILDALLAAETKSRRFANLRDMFADASSVPPPPPPDLAAVPPATETSKSRTRDAIASLRRILLEKREDDEEPLLVVDRAPPARRRSFRAWFGGAPDDGLPLESLLVATLGELSPELVIEKAVETLARALEGARNRHRVPARESGRRREDRTAAGPPLRVPPGPSPRPPAGPGVSTPRARRRLALLPRTEASIEDYDVVIEDEVDAPLTCPVPPRLDASEPAPVSEARGLRPAYDRGVARIGHSQVGRVVGADGIPEAIRAFVAVAEGTPWNEVDYVGADPTTLLMDIRAYYEEAALGLSDHIPGARSGESWYYQKTAMGDLVRRYHDVVKQADRPSRASTTSSRPPRRRRRCSEHGQPRGPDRRRHRRESRHRQGRGPRPRRERRDGLRHRAHHRLRRSDDQRDGHRRVRARGCRARRPVRSRRRRRHRGALRTRRGRSRSHRRPREQRLQGARRARVGRWLLGASAADLGRPGRHRAPGPLRRQLVRRPLLFASERAAIFNISSPAVRAITSARATAQARRVSTA